MIKSNAWVDKFQPKTVEECFLPSETKKQMTKIIKTGEISSMFFAGPPGIGKTTTALALCNELDLEKMLINASLHGNIDTVRTDIQAFSSTISFNGNKKVIILDEADGLTAAAQASLRAAINEYADNVAFILTANYRNKIIEPLISRFIDVNFMFAKEELPQLAIGIYKFIIERLDEEQVKYDPKAVQQFIRNQLNRTTDIRRILIGAQKIANTGVFEINSLINLSEARLSDLIPMIKSKDFDKLRTWTGENSDINFEDVVSYLYTNIESYGKGPYAVPQAITIINEHQYKHSFVVDKEINLTDMLASLSMNVAN